MKRARWLIAVWVLLLVGLLTVHAQAQGTGSVFLLHAQGPITPAMAEYLDRGLLRAERQGAEAVILQLDTPGGSVTLMNRMVQSIRGSAIPVIVYVAPRGAIAGSAGTVITLAGHLAVMAPETAIGAASPVGVQGEDLGETIATKEKEIIKATIRSLAQNRTPEALALAESTVEEAKAASAVEALDAGLVDFVASDQNELLKKVDGQVVETSAGSVRLQTAGAEIVEVPQSLIERLFQALTDPNVVFILLAVGVQAILIEISSPGGWVAGFIGVVSLVLGVYGIGVLPVNWVGLILIITAFVLFLLDIKAPTHGALTAAGLLAFITGALVLFNSPGTPEFERVSVPLVVTSGLIMAGVFLAILNFALRAQRRPVAVGTEALVGRVGVVRSPLTPRGTVHVAGELWSAELEGPEEHLDVGHEVVVASVEGMRLWVKPREASPRQASSDSAAQTGDMSHTRTAT
jgi:membrane-bound serine protease (ClpP class)